VIETQQIALALAPTILPTLTVLVGILLANRQNHATNRRMDEQFRTVNQRFDEVRREFDLTRLLFNEQLRRVEDVLDARLKHVEER
jgi:hypothetical protein